MPSLTLPWTQKHPYLVVDQKPRENVILETWNAQTEPAQSHWPSPDGTRQTWWNSRTQQFYRILTACLAFTCGMVLCWTMHYGRPPHHPPMTKYQHLAANATLGFEKILAVSRGTSWRVDGLHAAARLTGLEFEIPPQPPIAESLINAFARMGRDPNDKPRERGCTTAWLAHLKMLEYMIESGVSTALIVEDDVDWDVGIRRETALMADVVRDMTSVPEGAEQDSAYGSNWDLLWLGHCGTSAPESVPSRVWSDPSAIPHRYYQGFARDGLNQIPEGHRSMYPPSYTVCSFAYAVSRAGARRLLEILSRGEGVAFDLALSSAAADNRDTMSSYTVSPELFHHYRPAEVGDASSEVNSVNAGKPQEFHASSAMGRTGSILNSARCRALWGKKCVSNDWT